MIPEELERARKVRINKESKSEALAKANEARRKIEALNDLAHVELDDEEHFEKL